MVLKLAKNVCIQFFLRSSEFQFFTENLIGFSIHIDYMDKMCGNDYLVLDGDKKPGISFQLTSNSKYKPNSNCTVKFRAAQPSQRLIVTIEKMDIVDCPGDLLRIYDGTTLVNKDSKQQCGSFTQFTYTV